QAPQRASVRPGRSAQRLASRRVACLSRRVAHDGGSRLRAALPRRAGAAAPRQRNLDARADRLKTRVANRRRYGAARPAATSGVKVASARLTNASTTEPKIRSRAALATRSKRPEEG